MGPAVVPVGPAHGPRPAVERKKDAPPPLVPIMASDSEHAGVVANVEAGVIADLHSCDGRWCRVTVDQYSGYVEQKKLWGVYEGETIK